MFIHTNHEEWKVNLSTDHLYSGVGCMDELFLTRCMVSSNDVEETRVWTGYTHYSNIISNVVSILPPRLWRQQIDWLELLCCQSNIRSRGMTHTKKPKVVSILLPRCWWQQIGLSYCAGSQWVKHSVSCHDAKRKMSLCQEHAVLLVV